MHRIINLFSLFFLIIIISSCDKSNGNPEDNLPILTIDPLSIEENNKQSVQYLNLRLSEKSTEPVQIYISSKNGTAIGGEDFTSFESDVVTIESGQLFASYKFTVLGDEDPEEDETFTIEVIEVINAKYSTDIPVTITIKNDDTNNDLYIPESGYTSSSTYSGMTMIWQDEFNGDQISSSNWKFETGAGGWGNNELQYYVKDNAYIHNGNLVIEVKEESVGGSQYTSSRMITHNNFEFQYGRVDIRAALPYGQGIWPALWMLGNDIFTRGWPACGEIDIMELVGGTGRDNKIHGTAHWSNNSAQASSGGAYSLSSGIFYDEFHVFSLEWNETSLKWYVDDKLYYTLNIQDQGMKELRDHPYFFIFNVAVGGNWPGNPDGATIFPQRMIVDYIRVFQDQ